jgi:hypothetical protein
MHLILFLLYSENKNEAGSDKNFYYYSHGTDNVLFIWFGMYWLYFIMFGGIVYIGYVLYGVK